MKEEKVNRSLSELKLCSAVRCAHYVLRGSDLLGQLAALHCAEVQVLVEEFSVQDVPHGVLQASSVAVHHSASKRRDTRSENDTDVLRSTKETWPAAANLNAFGLRPAW